MDGVGEWATTSVCARPRQSSSRAQWELDFPHSLGLLYSAFTYLHRIQGQFRRIQADGSGAVRRAANTSKLILDHLIDLKQDGSFRLNMDYFNYCTGLTMTNRRFDALFRRPAARARGAADAARHGHRGVDSDGDRGDRAAARPRGRIARPASRICASPAAWRSTAWPTARFCATDLSTTSGFSRRRATPAERSARRWRSGISISASRVRRGSGDAMQGSYLGPGLQRRTRSNSTWTAVGALYPRLDEGELIERVAELAGRGEAVGWFQGRMEFGPRALGAARSSAIRAARHAIDDEPEDQIPRILSSLCTLSAGGARRRLVRARSAPAPTCCSSRRCVSERRVGDADEQQDCSASTSSTCRARQSRP